ncbi:MAG: hypothetical protein DRP89_04840 [Candidatus Neomarinimicrobiota bacterium]|nr:MAG: hypothetical protein DRP89_04840 [Candidatus Neomarinimicrobiota bacterium]
MVCKTKLSFFLNNKMVTVFIFILVLLILLNPSLLLSGINIHKIKISGTVYAWNTKEPLQNTNITVIGLHKGTTTDSSGNYILTLPPGHYTICFQYIGYKTEKRNITLSKTEETIELDIYLKPTVLRGEKISISAYGEEPKITRYEIPPAKLLTIANPLPDVLLSLKTLPGVSSGNDQSTFYNIRGGNYDENLIYLNGVEIYQPLLVRKGIAENPSLVNPYLIQSINLRTGAFPVNYGDKLSSVLDISYREGNTERVSGSAGVSTIKAELSLEGPFTRKTTWILGVRKINYGYLLDGLPTVKGNYTPDFKDMQGGLTFKPDSLNKIKLFGLYAESKYNFSPEAFVPHWNFEKEKIYYSDRLTGKESFTYQTGAIGLQWLCHVTNKFQTTVTLSNFSQKERENTHVKYYRYQGKRDSVPERIEIFDNHLKGSLTRLIADGKYWISSHHQLRFGVEVKKFWFKDRLHQAVEDSTQGPTDPAEQITSSDTIKSTGFALYGEYTWQPTSLLSISTGLRFTRFTFNGESLSLPRFSIFYHLTEHTSIILATGMYAQPPIYKEFRTREKKQSKNLKAQKSIQLTFGLEHKWGQNISFRVEAYYKWLDDLISYELWDVRTIYSGKNDAVGYAYGIDTYIRGDFIPDCLAWISYSYLVTRENIDSDGEGWVPRPSDQRHTFAATLQDKMERFPGSRIHIRLLFGSGYHYTCRLTRTDGEGNLVVEPGPRNACKIPFYERFDVGFSQKFHFSHSVKITMREEILNLFNHYNVLGYSWLNGQRIEHVLSERTYNIGITIDFSGQ